MASTFPGAIDSFTDPLSNSPLNSPSHSAQHADLNDAVEKVETYMGLIKVIPTGATNGTVGSTGTVTIGNAVSSVTVSGAFSSLYNHYRIVIANMGVSISNQFRMTFGATVTGYYYGVPLSTMSGGAYTYNSASNVAFIDLGSTNSGWKNDFNFDVMSPNLPTTTKLQGFSFGNSAQYGGVGNGFVDGTTQYTAFTFTPSTGTLTGGTITVYGYRI